MKYNQPYGITDTDAGYINGDPSVGRQGSIPPAECFEFGQREIVAVISGSGITPDNGDLTQLLQAVRSQRLNYGVATNTTSGDENAITVVVTPTFVEFVDGMPIRVKLVQDVSGACTLSVNGVQHPLKRSDGSELVTGDGTAGNIVDAVWQGTYWQMVNYAGTGGGGGGSSTVLVDIPYVADSGTANHITGIFSPAITSLSAGKTIEVKLAHSVTGPTDITVNALPAKAVKHPGGTDLADGDAVAGEVLLLIYDGTEFQAVGKQPATGGVSGPTHPAGEVFMWPLDTPPAYGYECNGQALDRTVDAVLFAKIGTRYGAGNGTTTFNVPNWSGLFPRVVDHGAGLDPNSATRTTRGDGTTGDHVGTKQADAFKSHTHPVDGSISAYFTSTLYSNTDAAATGYVPSNIPSVTAGGTMTGTAEATGGAETRPANFNILFCMAHGRS